MRKQRTSDYYSSDTEQITSEDIDVSATMAMDFPDIFVMRPQMQTNIGGSFKEAKQLYDNGDDEVRQLLLKECSLIYECKKCRNMFRSLTQFIGHKRVFCRSSVCNNDGDIAGGGNYNGFISNHVIATKKVSDDTSGICESVLENVIDNTSVQQTGILCENNELRDEKITGERAVTPPQAAEENEAEKIPKILSCPQERCKLSFSNTKELEKHFSEDHTNAIVFPSPVAQVSEQQTEPSVEHIIVQTRAKRTLSNTLHKCEHCGKGFERKEALVAHLMHCPVKHNILSKTLSAGVSGAMLAKRVKLQTFTEVAVEDPKTCASTNDPKESDLDKSAVLPRQPAVEVEVATKINETAPVLNQAINIKQEFIPQESIVTSTNTTSTILKKKKMKNRRPFIGTIGKQIKGGYLLRYKKQLLWNRWAEEWVVLYDDSTMAWFTEPGRSSPAGKILVKEAPEMLAIAHWTGQIPRRPPLPEGCSVSQLIALGSRRKRSKVYWMLAKSEQEVSDWVDAITKTLPPPPQIELVVDKPHLMNVLRRPLVRIRPATSSEVKQRKALAHRNSSGSSGSAHPALAHHRTFYAQNPLVKSDAAVAILSKKPDSKPALACALPWGHGWGWATLPNGVWSGGLTWSQCEDTFTLHALPTTHCTNLVDMSCSGAVYHTDIGGFDFHSTGVEDLGGEDFDYAMDCGDFIF